MSKNTIKNKITIDKKNIKKKPHTILIIGGGGIGAKWIPSFACLDTDALVEVGSTKIGTGRYVDCP